MFQTIFLRNSLLMQCLCRGRMLICLQASTSSMVKHVAGAHQIIHTVHALEDKYCMQYFCYVRCLAACNIQVYAVTLS